MRAWKSRLLAASGFALASMTAMSAGNAQAQDTAAHQASTAQSAEWQKADQMAEKIVSQLTLDEKFDQLLNTAPAIPRLKIPAYNWWTESLHGALGPVPTTNFPEPVGLAATFDTELVHDVAGSISTEVRGLHALGRETGKLGRIGTGLDTWSPNINIFRDPRWGRGQETYGEDPFLTARMGVAYVEGMQGPNPDLPDVVATPKHFAVHNGPEATRHHANVFVSKHDLEDTYLPAFRAAIVEAKAGSVMCAYNRVDGAPACASEELLKDTLRDAWGFTGYVVSDCDAVRDISENHHYAPDPATGVTAALWAGVDNECNTQTLSDTAGLGERYRDALNRGLITENDIDRALVRLFSARYRNGDLAGVRPLSTSMSSVRDIATPAHRALALKAAERSLVLLKNDGILPFQTAGMRVAVIGPLGDATRVLRGNYSSPMSGEPVSVLEGLRAAMPKAKVQYVPFGESYTDSDTVPESALQTEDGKPGLTAHYYNPIGKAPERFAPGELEKYDATVRYEAKPALIQRESDVHGRGLGLGKVADHHKVVWTGFIVPKESGTYRLGLGGRGGVMNFEGKPFIDMSEASWGTLPNFKTVTLEAGHKYPVEVSSQAMGSSNVGLVWKKISADPVKAMQAAARDADVLVAVVGLTSDLEAEEAPVEIPGFDGGDKTTLDLPADQLALLAEAKKTGKPIVLVAMNGSPINLSWAKDNAAAVLEAWYPGETGGEAIANVLTGKTNPSGRLPLTFYRSVDDLPPFEDYDMKGRTYRYFEGKPVYSFGYGLSYTDFTYAPLTITPSAQGAGQGLRVATEIRNSGSREGDEVAQLYLNFPDKPGTPEIALRGFQRVTLKPGESRKVVFDLTPRDLSAVDLDGNRMVFTGNYTVSVGSAQPGSGLAFQSGSFSVQNAVALPK
ncbi:glycoside hydrolase family 3 C-terminal domain-containing protein [Altericroceibacterium indicum]|nr:glycoside hydrolase family 3 C-terminal domain-containing protein [Altericroceibacterium indicum]